jgi:NAD(P)-dependent dehydrogenase (short-subunit alcohol dehydrogenase family)/acyl dehydratase
MTYTLRIGAEQLQRFADASGDRNPLHTNDAFARFTPYGRPIAQGALVTIAGLAVVGPDLLTRLETLHVQFKQAVFPEEEYAASLLESDPDGAQIELTRDGRVAVAISCTFGRVELPSVVERAEVALRDSPARPSVEELAGGDRWFEEPFAADLEALGALATDLGAGHVPRTILLWLAAASYTVGMVVPGEHAVFVAARIASSASNRLGLLNGSVTTVDERTGLVNVDVVLHHGDASATMGLQTFLRPVVPPPDRASVARYLAPSPKLADRNVLVVGGSRGLGAALAAGFATQGATVWVSFARSASHLDRLRSEFGADRIYPLQFDASDPVDGRAAFTSLRQRVGVLDGVVLCAAPPLYETSMHTDASESTLQFVDASVAMTLLPLAESLPLLSPEGWLVLLSSSAIEDPPEAWPQYVIAKSAVEGAAAYARRFGGTRVLVARPPTMWTDSTNTPLARLGAIPKEQVAAAIVRWALGEAASDEGLLDSTRLKELAPERAGH